MLRGSRARGPQHADRMRVVQDEHGAELLRELEEVGHVGDVALHAEDAIHDDHHPRLGRATRFQEPTEPGQLSVVEPEGLPEREPRAVHDARMVQLVQEDAVVPPAQGRDDAQVRLIAGAEDESRLHPRELREPALQLLVEVQIAVQEAAARVGRAVLPEGRLGRLDDLRVVREAQVVVRPDHDLPLAADHHLRVRRPFDRGVIWIIARGHDLAGASEIPAFLEQMHPTSGGQVWRIQARSVPPGPRRGKRGGAPRGGR